MSAATGTDQRCFGVAPQPSGSAAGPDPAPTGSPDGDPSAPGVPARATVGDAPTQNTCPGVRERQPVRRRHVLTLLGTASLTVPASGCLGGMPGDAVVRAVPGAEPGGTTPVRYRDLPAPEQEIARTAITEPFYHACPELPDALRSFASRFDAPDTAYLTREGEPYGLWIRIEDTVRAGTASSPDADPSCGVL